MCMCVSERKTKRQRGCLEWERKECMLWVFFFLMLLKWGGGMVAGFVVIFDKIS